jgi:hypothetical protein
VISMPRPNPARRSLIDSVFKNIFGREDRKVFERPVSRGDVVTIPAKFSADGFFVAAYNTCDDASHLVCHKASVERLTIYHFQGDC